MKKKQILLVGILYLICNGPLSAETFSTFLRENFKMDLSATQEGPIFLYVEEGARVKKGQVLFGGETKELELNVTLAELQWQQAKVNLKKVLNPLTGQELEFETLQFEQKKSLFKAGGLSEDAFRLVQAEYQLKTRESRPEDIAIAKLGAETKQLQLKLSQEALSKATFKAPLPGRVNKLHVQHNEWVKPGQKVLELININPLYVVVNTPLIKVSKLSIDTKTTVEVSFGGKKIETYGTIRFISDEVDAVTQTVRIRIEISNHDNRFKPGMLANVGLP